MLLIENFASLSEAMTFARQHSNNRTLYVIKIDIGIKNAFLVQSFGSFPKKDKKMAEYTNRVLTYLSE